MKGARLLLILIIATGVACSSGPSGGGTSDASDERDTSQDDVAEDTASDVDDADDSPDAADVADTADTVDTTDTTDADDVDESACAQLPPAPTERIEPTPGELYYIQVGLGGFSLGESALMVGPEGTIVAFDVGNDSHDDDVRDVLAHLEQQMSSAGFPARDADTVDHIVVTHYHADHGDGVTDLLENVSLAGRIVTRGMYDLTEAANPATAAKACDAVAANPGSGVALCTGAEAAPCDDGTWTGTYPASGCPGLAEGDLMDPNDGASTSYFALGEARLEFLAANGVIGGESFADQVGPLDSQDGNGENARSILALMNHGRFRMLLTGDLTGGGDDTDDVESFYASRLAEVSDIDERGIDVLHAGHHGRKTSTNATWLARLFPSDGQARNVVMGISTAHLNSPHQEVLDRIDSQGLGGGSIWTTTVATGGDTVNSLVDADGGHIALKTVGGGDGYIVQAINGGGQVVTSEVFAAARCP